jgi:hypothetical protein
MPNLLAHNLVIKRFYIKEDELSGDDSDSTHFIRNNLDFLSLGSQGPDPLFFVGVIPFHALHLFTAKKKFGNQIHQSDGKKYFRLLIEEAYTIEDDLERARFQSFILGQLAHYFLDREAHPYILYETGFDEDGKITGKYHYLHAHYEAQIDVCLAKKWKMTYFLDNPSDALPADKDFLRIIDMHFVPVLRRFFNDNHIPKKIYSNGITNMRSVIRNMNHHGKIKAKLIGKNSLSALYLPIDSADPKVLNESKEIWLDPVTGAKRNDSFIQIHSRAYELLDQCYNDILRNGFNYGVVSKYLNGLDYYGLPVGVKWTHKAEESK